MNTTIQTKLRYEKWVATTPHMPLVECEADTESQAVNGLIAELRKQFSAGPVDWIVEPSIEDGPDTITCSISGVWPLKITTTGTPDVDAPAPEPNPPRRKRRQADEKEMNDG